MADFGADVIKIEAPGGDSYRGVAHMPGLPVDDIDYGWQVDNRSKRSLCLDLAAGAGREVLHRLLARADVLITNFLPGVRAKLGLRHEELAERYPRLIFASMSAYGETGPEAEKSGFDTTALWARSGLMDLVRSAPGAAPSRSLPGLGDHPTGIALFAAIMAGLWRRERTGQGGQVSSSLVSMGLWMNAFYAQAALNGAEIPVRPARDEAKNALTNLYECADGRWFMLALLAEDRDAPRFFGAIGQEGLIRDPRFADTRARRANARALTRVLDGIFIGHPWAHWHALLVEARLTFGAVARITDHADDPQLRHAGAIIEDAAGRLTVGSPVFLDGEDKRIPTPAPAPGEHSREILAEAGFDAPAIDGLIAGGVVRQPPGSSPARRRDAETDRRGRPP